MLYQGVQFTLGYQNTFKEALCFDWIELNCDMKPGHIEIHGNTQPNYAAKTRTFLCIRKYICKAVIPSKSKIKRGKDMHCKKSKPFCEICRRQDFSHKFDYPGTIVLHTQSIVIGKKNCLKRML